MTLNARIVSEAEWFSARKELLAKEKEFTRQRDALSAERRKLPWVKVEKKYVFDATGSKETLAELFGNKSQLMVYHFMFGPGWIEGCPSCSFLADQFDGIMVHLANRDVALRVVSRAPIDEIETFRKRMGWKFHWVSSFSNDFNRDYQVSATKEEMAQRNVIYNYATADFPSEERPGLSVFYKDQASQIDLSHLFDLRTRARHLARRVQFSRSRAYGTRRGRSQVSDGMGTAPR